MHKNYVVIQNLYFSFLPGIQPFFENMSIHFKRGHINFVCGKNGMGKSTLLKILSGQIQQNLQGTLLIDDQLSDLKNLGSRSDRIALVAQNFNSMLVDTYSFYQNLQFALLPAYPLLKSLQQPLPLPHFVEKYGIDVDLSIERLSGGQRQILSILMVLQRSPEILLLDEPTAALDEENSALVMDFLQDLCVQENITVIAIVHDLHLVTTYAHDSYFELYQEHGVRKIKTVDV